MATIMSYAQLSDGVYESKPQVGGWSTVVLRPSGERLTDAFQGAAFQRDSEMVIAYKGTSQARDVVADAKLAVGMNTHQYHSAVEFTRRFSNLRGLRLSVTGHSLGGAIAQIVANRLRLPFVTFNAPGVGLISRNVGEVAATVGLGTAAIRTIGAVGSALLHPKQAMADAGSLFYWVRGVNFRLGKDVVGSTGVHYGKVIEIPYAGGALDVLAKHKMTTMIEALEESSYGPMQLESIIGAR